MTRPSKHVVTLLAAAAAGLLASGCRDKVEELSTATYTLGVLHKVWLKTRESLAAEPPDLNFLRSVEICLDGRTRRAVEMKYDRPNKQQVLAKLVALADAWNRDMMSMVDPSTFAVKLKAGYTAENVRDVFEKLDGEYRKLEAMTAGR